MQNFLENNLKASLFYLKNGRSVIPVGKNKIPLVNWKIYQEKMATEEEVKNWYNLYPEAQVGLVTGKISNLTVVDIEKGGKTDWLPETAVAKTGGGGWHYYYQYAEGVQNKARIKDLVDIRGEGGYVVAPPSFSDKGQYEWIKKIPFTKFPNHLFEERPIYTGKDYQPMSSEYPGYGEGQRNDQMTRYIGHLLAKVHPSEWDSIALQTVMLANQKNNPPLSDNELLNIFESIKNAEKRSGANRWYHKKEQENLKEENIWEGLGDEVVSFQEAVNRQQFDVKEKVSLGFDLFDQAQNGGSNWGDLITVAGPSGHGKTSLAQTFTYHLVKQAIPTLWFSYEVLLPFLWDKFKEMSPEIIDLQDWLLYTPFKNTTGNVDWIAQKVREAKNNFSVKVVVIDHLGFLLPKSKMQSDLSRNYSAYLGQICRDLKTLALSEEVIIILMAHMRKTEEPNINDIANSAAISQESDTVFTIVREVDPEQESSEYFTPYTQIVLAKNRKTGRTVKGWFYMDKSKFFYEQNYIPKKKIKKNKFSYNKGGFTSDN